MITVEAAHRMYYKIVTINTPSILNIQYSIFNIQYSIPACIQVDPLPRSSSPPPFRPVVPLERFRLFAKVREMLHCPRAR